jgi:peptidoglycan-associated lipoprotein
MHMMKRTGFRVAAVGLVGLAGCAHVSQDDLALELEQVRAEIREGDDAVDMRLSEQIGSLESSMDQRMAALEGDLRALEGEFEVTVERLESAIRFNAPVHFAFDDATVRTVDQPLLDRFAQVVSEYYGEALITVEGFTDPSGSAEYNVRLGQARADAVKDYLAGRGLADDRMRSVSYGEAAERRVIPDGQGPGEPGWQNRRVALVIDFGAMAEGPPTISLQGGVTLDP